jgi:hypothetical protein
MEVKQYREVMSLYEELPIKFSIYKLELEKYKAHQQLFSLYRQQYSEGELLPSIFLQRKMSFQDAQIVIKKAQLNLLILHEKLISKCREKDSTFWDNFRKFFLKSSIRKIVKILFAGVQQIIAHLLFQPIELLD